jgi:hypothetical protein
MANLDVSQLSVVIKHKEQLLEYSATPTKGTYKLSEKSIMLKAIVGTSTCQYYCVCSAGNNQHRSQGVYCWHQINWYNLK